VVAVFGNAVFFAMNRRMLPKSNIDVANRQHPVGM
jgi:hypothetical protein